MQQVVCFDAIILSTHNLERAQLYVPFAALVFLIYYCCLYCMDYIFCTKNCVYLLEIVNNTTLFRGVHQTKYKTKGTMFIEL